MKYIATINDETYEVDINANGEILLDGEPLRVDFQPVAELSVYSMLLDNRSFEAHVHPTEAGWEVMIRGQYFLVNVEDERQRRLRQSSGSVQAQSGDFNLKAPMPGLIVAVPVQEGQEIEEGELLVVLESMKMQNELKAPRAGIVARVRVSQGDSVEQNQVMLTLN